MPSVKMPKKSTATDMTPFVDIAFLILSFFIMATKFKPEEPVKVETPESVSSDLLEENNALIITIAPDSKVYVAVSALGTKEEKAARMYSVINEINEQRNLSLSPSEVDNFLRTPAFGVPFNKLKGYLALSQDEQKGVVQEGIPVLDSLNNELVWWVAATKQAFAGKKLLYMVKGDNSSKYPTFEGIINAMRRNEEFKYHLITSQEGAPEGTELYRERQAQ